MLHTPSIYVTRVMHLRMLTERQRKHQFRYSVFRFWLNVDCIEETLGCSVSTNAITAQEMGRRCGSG